VAAPLLPVPVHRWQRCIWHRGRDASDFVPAYFGQGHRRVLLVGGAGFDPRSTILCALLAQSHVGIRALFIREERPNPATHLLSAADANSSQLTTLATNHQVLPIEIFGSDNAVIGGRNAVRAIDQHQVSDFTDVIVDLSALSIGTSYPIVRYFRQRAMNGLSPPNVHVFVAQNAELDERISPVTAESVVLVHGFRGGWALDQSASAAKLWLPQLARGRRQALQRIYEAVSPHDTCPVFPFPSRRPRLGDDLAEHFLVELESAWEVDPRNFIYAAEDDPLDLYRTLMRIDDLRQRVFAETGGSVLVLSPTGSKVLALGALMAALERDMPVAYLEAIAYDFPATQRGATPPADQELIHVWLEGDCYADSSSTAPSVAGNR
jgi:hypothetical protein